MNYKGLVSLKVSSEMTAGRLCAEIVAQKNLSCDTDWVLFEVIDDGAMGESSLSFQSVISPPVRCSYQALEKSRG